MRAAAKPTGCVPPVVALAAALRARGVDKDHARTLRRRGELTQLWRGVDLLAADEPETRRAAAVALSPWAVLTGPSAARAWGLDVPRQWPDEISIGDGRSPVRTRSGLRVVARHVPVHDRAVVDGLPVSSLARTVADLLCRPELADALWIWDQALRRGLTARDIESQLRPRQRGCRHARELIPLGRCLSESALETRMRLALHVAGLPEPVLQHEVRDGGAFVARVDFAWPERRVLLEADGVAFHEQPAALFADRRRQNRLAALGWLPLRATWADVGSGDAVAAAAVALARPPRAPTPR